MKTITLLLLACLILSCNSNSKKENNPSLKDSTHFTTGENEPSKNQVITQPEPEFYDDASGESINYFEYVGKLGETDISMHLQLTGDLILEGFYIYTSNKSCFELRGHIDPMNSEVILNRFKDGEIRETFTGNRNGEFMPKNFSGTWKKSGQTKSFNLSLIEHDATERQFFINNMSYFLENKSEIGLNTSQISFAKSLLNTSNGLICEDADGEYWFNNQTFRTFDETSEPDEERFEMVLIKHFILNDSNNYIVLVQGINVSNEYWGRDENNEEIQNKNTSFNAVIDLFYLEYGVFKLNSTKIEKDGYFEIYVSGNSVVFQSQNNQDVFIYEFDPAEATYQLK